MGDPACYLSSVCLTCGTFLETVDVSVCPHCGEEIEGTAGFELDALRTRGPSRTEPSESEV